MPLETTTSDAGTKPVSKKTELMRKVKAQAADLFTKNPAFKTNPAFTDLHQWATAAPGVFGGGQEKIFPVLFPDPKVGSKVTFTEAYNKVHKDESSLRDKAREWKLKKGIDFKFTIDPRNYGNSTIEIIAISPVKVETVDPAVKV